MSGRKTLKNKKMGSRVFKYMGSPVPTVVLQNVKRGMTYKLPTNLLQPREILLAKQKNKANAAKLADEVRRTHALEAERARRERLESQARFAALLRLERERLANAQSVGLLPAFDANNEAFVAKPKRGPGARGTGANMVALPTPTRTIPPNLLRMMRGESVPKAPTPQATNHSTVVKLLGNLGTGKTLRKANLLKAQRAAEKATGAGEGPAPPKKPMGKFWKKEGTNNSNSSNSD